MELFRALSAFHHLYTELGVDAKLSNEKVVHTHVGCTRKLITLTHVLHNTFKVESAFQYIWFHFYSIVTVLLRAWKDKNASFSAVESCLDIIYFAISTAVYVEVGCLSLFRFSDDLAIKALLLRVHDGGIFHCLIIRLILRGEYL